MKATKEEKNVKPIYFSKYFNISPEKLKELGCFNPILNFDTKLFVDPLILKDCKDEFSKESFTAFNEFFTKLLKLLILAKQEKDNAWKQAKRMVSFPEYKETCIGYAGKSIDGSGSGANLHDKIFETAKEIINNAKNDSEIFLLLPLLEEGIGADRISDMTQSIIDTIICKYTVDIMQKLDLTGNYTYKTTTRTFNETPQTFNLLKNPFSNCAIKFIPKNILRTLPDYENDILEAVSFNQELRDRISMHIGQEWHKTAKKIKKEALIDLIKKDKEVFYQVLKAIKEASFIHYDLEKDTEGLYRWLSDSEKFFNAPKIVESEDTLDAIENSIQSIVNHFQNLIENQNLWRIFFTKDNGKIKQVREFYSQMLFYMVCDSWLNSQSSNIKFIKEHNQTTKQIDFIFRISNKNTVRVNIKHTNNTRLLDAYKKQMKFLTTEKSTRGLFVVLNCKDKLIPQFAAIKEIEKDLCKITKIEAKMQENIGELIEFEEEEKGETMQQKGAKARHSKTNIMKNHIVKPLFTNKLIKSKTVQQRADKINNLLSTIYDKNQEKQTQKISKFAKEYNLNHAHLTNSIDYFKYSKSETIYRWCLAFSKKKA